MERKLTAILCADVYGYSRLMGQNEEATLHTLSAYRKIIDGLIGRHHGRFVNSAGDSVLAEFASIVEAVNSAVEIQAALKSENANLQPECRMEFRIGVNSGDVMVEDEQIYGDGVNVAARLESRADPGGICISGTVHEHVKNKLALNYQDLCAQRVKNIAEPVRVYAHLSDGDVVITLNWDAAADRSLFEAGRWSPRDGYGFQKRLLREFSSNPADLGLNHQVLAYDYRTSASHVTVLVYDPNSGQRDDINIQFDSSSPTKPTVFKHNLSIDDPVRGFFRTAYALAAPPAR